MGPTSGGRERFLRRGWKREAMGIARSAANIQTGIWSIRAKPTPGTAKGDQFKPKIES